MNAALKSQIEVLLDRSEMKKTSLRFDLLGELLRSSEPMSQADLIRKLESKERGVDRVTIYRNLNQMKTAGLVHEVEHNNYVACSHECEAHPHILLFCQTCEKHEEVRDHGRINKIIDVLGGLRFFGKNAPLFLRGICAECSAS